MLVLPRGAIVASLAMEKKREPWERTGTTEENIRWFQARCLRLAADDWLDRVLTKEEAKEWDLEPGEACGE